MKLVQGNMHNFRYGGLYIPIIISLSYFAMSSSQLELYLQQNDCKDKMNWKRKRRDDREPLLRWLGDVSSSLSNVLRDKMISFSAEGLSSIHQNIFGYKLLIFSYMIHANHLEFMLRFHSMRLTDPCRSITLPLSSIVIICGFIALGCINRLYTIYLFAFLCIGFAFITWLCFIMAYQLRACLRLIESSRTRTQHSLSFLQQIQHLYLGNRTWNPQPLAYAESCFRIESTNHESVDIIKKALFLQLKILSEDLGLESTIPSGLSLHNQIHELRSMNSLVFASAIDLLAALVADESFLSILKTPVQMMSIYTCLQRYDHFIQGLLTKYFPRSNGETSSQIHQSSNDIYMQAYGDLRRQLISIRKKHISNSFILHNLDCLLSSPEFLTHVLERNVSQVQQMLSSSTIFTMESSSDRPYSMLTNQLDCTSDIHALCSLLKKLTNPTIGVEETLSIASSENLTAKVADETSIRDYGQELDLKQEFIDGMEDDVKGESDGLIASAEGEWIGKHVDVYIAIVSKDSKHTAILSGYQEENNRLEEKRRSEQLLHELKLALSLHMHDTIERIRRLPGDNHQESSIEADDVLEDFNAAEADREESELLESVSIPQARIASLLDLQSQLSTAIRTRNEVNVEDVYD